MTGTRDLACPDLWERSLARSRLRRELAAQRRGPGVQTVSLVAEVTKLTPLPHAPPEVAGLTARGGAVYPVFHLRAVLGLPLAALPEHGRIDFRVAQS